MNVTLNLSTSTHARERWALTWSVPTLLVGLAGLAWLAFSGLQVARDFRTVHHSVEELRGGLAKMQEQEGTLKRQLAQPQYRQILTDAQFVNTLIERKKQLTLTGLAARVAKLLPDKVRLNGLALTRQKDGSSLVRFVVNAKSEEAIDSFLSNLGDSPDFRDVAIANQGFEQEGSAPVNLTCTARYEPREP